jgi:hypothetical protein
MTSVSIHRARYQLQKSVSGPLTYLPCFGRETASKVGLTSEHQLFNRLARVQNETGLINITQQTFVFTSQRSNKTVRFFFHQDSRKLGYQLSQSVWKFVLAIIRLGRSNCICDLWYWLSLDWFLSSFTLRKASWVTDLWQRKALRMRQAVLVVVATRLR